MSDFVDVAVKKKDLSISARKVREEVAHSVRGSIEHLKYATPEVQLAWGQGVHDKRIHHVDDVENGQNCNCVCPACREALISKQGTVRTWHFAHQNGKECRNAVSAAIARFLAQRLTDGLGLDLPETQYYFAGTTRTFPVRKDVTFDRATAQEDSSGHMWEVLAEKDAGGRTGKLRILIRTNAYTNLPKSKECQETGISTMVIDLGFVLSNALDIDPDLCTDQDWITTQVVSEAPRSWIWSAAADRMKQTEFENKIQPYLDAIETYARSVEKANRPAMAEIVKYLGYIDLVSGGGEKDVPGAFIFARPSSEWRSEILLEMILRPIALAHPKNPPYSNTVLGWRQSGAACRRLSLIPPLFLRKIDRGIQSEIQMARSQFREPVRVIDCFFEELAEANVLRRRPKSRNQARLTTQYDEELWKLKGASYSIAPGFLSQVKSQIDQHPEWREIIVKKALPKH